MRSAKCNICGEEWKLVDEKGYHQVGRLRITGYHHYPTGYKRVDVDLCGPECAIVWARERLKEEDGGLQCPS